MPWTDREAEPDALSYIFILSYISTCTFLEIRPGLIHLVSSSKPLKFPSTLAGCKEEAIPELRKGPNDGPFLSFAIFFVFKLFLWPFLIKYAWISPF